MADAGNEQGVVEILRDHVAPAVEQHRRDGAGVARQHGAHMGVDGVAQPLHHGVGPGHKAGRRWRRNHIDRAADKAGGADLLEIKIAGEIVRARRQRLQRRIEHGFDFDEGARGRRQPALDREPHPLRLVVDAVAVDAVDAQHEAVGVLALFAQLDKARDGHARGRIVQHRVFDHGGFHRGGGKARGDRRKQKDRR